MRLILILFASVLAFSTAGCGDPQPRSGDIERVLNANFEFMGRFSGGVRVRSVSNVSCSERGQSKWSCSYDFELTNGETFTGSTICLAQSGEVWEQQMFC
jgi:hypothetical protein